MPNFRKDFYADVRREKRYASDVRFIGPNLVECRESTIEKAFIRVYDGKMWYYCSTDDMDKIQEELDGLYSCATPNPDIANDPIVKKFEINKDTGIKYEKNCVKNVPLEKKREFLEKRKNVVENDEYLKQSGASYGDRHSLFDFTSSLGANLTFDTQSVRCAISISLAYGKETFDDGLIAFSDSFETLKMSKEKLIEFKESSDEFLLKAKSVEPGRFPVVLSPAAAGIFAHESFGHKSESDFMLGDETMKKEWTLGKEVASPILSIYDTGTIPGAGYVPYDDEGTKMKKTYLIKNGVLSGRLHSAKTAAELGEELTGNARAINCDYEPIVSMTTTLIEGRGNDTKDDLISRIKYGYYIKNCKHGSGMSTFTIAPNVAYRIENGKITAPVKIAVISGNVFDTLGKIDGVSRAQDTEVSAGNCGKMEQYPLPVALGGAYISVSEMDVQ